MNNVKLIIYNIKYNCYKLNFFNQILKYKLNISIIISNYYYNFNSSYISMYSIKKS